MSKLHLELPHPSHLPIFQRDDWRYAILMGGRGNARSGTASRFTISQLLGKEYTQGAIMRAVLSDIRTSCWGELMNRVHENELNRDKDLKITDNDMTMEYGGNSLKAMGFRASSGNLTARLKSLAEFNYLWIEEGEEIGEDEFRILDDSLRTIKGRIRIVITLNTPPKNHWMLRKWFDLIPHPTIPGFYTPTVKKELTDTIFIGGTYRENESNLDKHTVERYKAYEYSNPNYFYQVIEGLSPEEVRGKIYSGWQQIERVPTDARLVALGEDFGWFPDPAALVAVWYWNGSYVIDELAYGNYLTNEFLAGEAVKTTGPHSSIICHADSAEPKSIEEQRKYGMTVRGVEKGKGSIEFRIKATAQKKIYITKRSVNIWQSYENYAWDEDKDGNPKGQPVHTWSHGMDAVSYAIAALHNKVSDRVVHQPPRVKKNIAL